ncbi:unnamed protein product [Ectocarpus sp. CCAP 1310/34]|nr:unnamed protein product [Ectocarpus sp. CCAP 1310/34]
MPCTIVVCQYDDSEDDEAEGGRRRQPVTAAIRAIRADIKTYTEDVPDSQSERFSAFVAKFDLGARTKDVATILKEDPVVTKIHTQLVPEHLTYDDFWTRYFFRAEKVAKGKAGGGMSFPNEGEVVCMCSRSCWPGGKGVELQAHS